MCLDKFCLNLCPLSLVLSVATTEKSQLPHNRYLNTLMRCPQAFSANQIGPALIFQKKPQFLHVFGPVLDSVSPCFLWRPRTGCSSPAMSLSRGKGSLPSTLLILQPRIVFPTLGTPVPGWLMVSLLSARTLRSFCADLPSSWLVPCVYSSLGYSFPSTGLCISVTVLPALFSSLSTSGWQHNHLVH